MAIELDNQILKEFVALIKDVNKIMKYITEKMDGDIKDIWANIADLYKSMVGFWWLLTGIIDNRLMIIQTAIPAIFQTGETKAKIEESERERDTIINLILRMDNYWNKFFENAKDTKQLLLIRGKIQEISDQLNPHLRSFFRLTDEVWKDYRKWSKEMKRGNEGEKMERGA